MATPLPLAQELRDVRTGEIIDALDTDFLTLVSWDWNLRVVLNRVQRDLHRGFDLTSWAIDAYPSAMEQRFWQDRGVEIFEMTIEQFLTEMDAV